MESQLALANAKIESLERECVNLSKNQDKLTGQQNKKELKLQLTLAKAKLECLEKEFLKLSKNQDRHEGEQSSQGKNLKQALTKIGNLEMDFIEMYKELEKRESQERQARLVLEKQIEELRNEMTRRHSEERLKATSRQAMENPSVVASDWPLLQKIQPFFVFQVHPQNVLPIIHKYDTKVLTQRDIQEVQCATQNHGSIQGASELLSRTVRYKGWRSCLMSVLRDSNVQLSHVADKIEEVLGKDELTRVNEDLCGEFGTLQVESMAKKEQNNEKEIRRQVGGKDEKDISYPDQSKSESDEVETGIEYIMKKTHYRLAKQYFEGCLEEQYLSKAENTEEGYLFSLCSNDTNDIRFLKVLRKLKFEIVGHAKDDTPKVKLIADQLKCKDLNVKVIEHGSKSYLVGPREKVAEVKQRIISKLQENEETASSFDTPENSVRQKSQPGMRDDMNSFSRSSDGGTRHQSPEGVLTGSSSSVSGATAKSVEKDTVYLVRELQLCISSRSALSIQSDLVITVGEEFDKLSGIPDYNIKANMKPCDYVPKKKSCNRFSVVHKPFGKHGRLLCRLFPDPKSATELSSAFENLSDAIRLAAIREDKVEDVKSFVLTSSVLYAEPSNKKKETPNVIDRTLVGNFGKLVFDYVEKMSKESSCKVKQVFVTASEEASVVLCKVLEARTNDTSAPGAYPHTRPRDESPPRWGLGSRGGSTSSLNSGGARANHGLPSSGSGDKNSHTQYRGRDNPTAHSSDFKSSEYEKYCSKPSTRTQFYGPGSSVDSGEECQVCRDDSKKGVPVSCCGHLICFGCELKVDRCPFCKKFWRVRTGNQPDGRMYVRTINDYCDGYEHCKTWKIDYNFEEGIQKDNHPHPGRMYYSTIRTAYIPTTEGALLVLKMLKLAFMRRLTFTIGHSRTRNKDDLITWNDIHHKTSCHSGTHGYPDPKYLGSVYYELLNNGVTMESMTDEERQIMSKFEYDIKTIGYSFGS